MLGPGFLGTRGDLVLDAVICSLALVLPLMLFSYLQVRKGNYVVHRNVQTGLGLVLFVVILVFEGNLKYSGGIFKLTQGSGFAGTPVLDASIYTHMVFSISTAVLWVLLIPLSLIRFRPPQPGSFSRVHVILGRIGMIDMLLTGITAIVLYLVGFVY